MGSGNDEVTCNSTLRVNVYLSICHSVNGKSVNDSHVAIRDLIFSSVSSIRDHRRTTPLEEGLHFCYVSIDALLSKLPSDIVTIARHYIPLLCFDATRSCKKHPEPESEVVGFVYTCLVASGNLKPPTTRFWKTPVGSYFLATSRAI